MSTTLILDMARRRAACRIQPRGILHCALHEAATVAKPAALFQEDELVLVIDAGDSQVEEIDAGAEAVAAITPAVPVEGPAPRRAAAGGEGADALPPHAIDRGIGVRLGRELAVDRGALRERVGVDAHGH